MTRLRLLTESAVARLRGSLRDPTALATYRDGSFEFPAEDQLTSSVEVPDMVPELQWVGPDCDAVSSIALYQWLGPLEEVLATDERLWVALTHGQFAQYTRLRWPLPVEGSKADASVLSHWFVGGGLGGLRRNSVARLWWAAHLTHAPWDDQADGGDFAALKPDDGDSFVYTRVLLSLDACDN